MIPQTQGSLIITCFIDAMEGRDVAVSNIPGAFLQMDMVHVNRIVRIRLWGVLVDLLVKIDLVKFSEKLVLEGGQKVIYSSLKKALYGALIASQIFWRDLSGALGSWVFDTNLYDSCIMNKTMDKKYSTIFWHVDDLKRLHVSPKVVDGVLSESFQLHMEFSFPFLCANDLCQSLLIMKTCSFLLSCM